MLIFKEEIISRLWLKIYVHGIIICCHNVSTFSLGRDIFFVATYRLSLFTFHSMTDTYFMQQAIAEARKAADAGEVPVGAVIVCDGRIIARGHNLTERLSDVTAHAEIIALTAASEYLGSKYLDECALFVTLEPCVMCAGALAWAQLGRLVYAASDDKRGFMRFGKELLHPKTKVEMGIFQDEASALIKDFFKDKR
jgi:tRNA(adenine34) deaminase